MNAVDEPKAVSPISLRIAQGVRIGAEEIAHEEVLARLAENYRAHGWPDDAPSYAFPGEGEGAEDPYFLLYQLQHLDANLWREPNPSTLPLFGPLVDALRRSLHRLVLYYVNRALAHAITAAMIESRLIAGLLKELAEVKERLAAIEGRFPTEKGG